MKTATPCSCDEALALRAQLKKAAAHIGELLTTAQWFSQYGDKSPGETEIREEARAFLAAYTARGGA